MANVEKDALTGTETTGHEWDGIKELNTPLPKWWVYTFYATIIWAIGYWVVYPSWPTLSDYSKGMWNYSTRGALAEDLAAQKAERGAWLGKFEGASVGDIKADPNLLKYAMAGGKFIFNENCAPCHGAGGAGAPGYPNLADDDWIWGGSLEAIEETVRYGVRGIHDDTRVSDMPRFVEDELLTEAQVGVVADYVLSLASGGAEGEGKVLFEDQCTACHGEDGKGSQDTGGPNLTDGIWLYGSGKDAVVSQIVNPKHGVMPTWEGRLDDTSIKQVTVYVHTLGGGQ